MRKGVVFVASIAVWVAVGAGAGAERGVIATRHNLSANGRGAPTLGSEVCRFCHVTQERDAPRTYTPYSSTTLVSPQPGAPSGSTRMCLSCHDGTIALAQSLRPGANLGRDLRTTHPVSFSPAISPELKTPPRGDPVRLDERGQVQCISCHDPHRDEIDPVQRMFLVKRNRASALCLTCHGKAYWQSNPSSHQSSLAVFDAQKGAQTAYTTVADNGCESCHRPHGAKSTSRLLASSGADLCLKCHAGQVAARNLSADFSKSYVHPVQSANADFHDPAEGSRSLRKLPETSASAPRHVQCVDCHNPHAAFNQRAQAPRVSGALSGVWGIDRAGSRVDPARYEHEICFKCHGDSANQPQRNGPLPPESVRRAVTDVNLRQRFDLAAASYHPVEGPGRGSDVPSLIAPLTTSSIIYCTDCHPPHGSSHRHMLERGFTTAYPTMESEAAYALCYKCHDRDVLMSEKSAFKLHPLHVQKEKAPCSACHDWHGVSAVQGNPLNNAHLINFDVSYVGRTAKGLREYVSEGWRKGRCSLKCHRTEHVETKY